MQSNLKQTILIVGAGYAGLRCALDLELLLRLQNRLQRYEIVLVDQYPYHQLITELHRAAAGSLPVDQAIVPLYDLLHRRAIKFVQGRITGLNPAQKSVSLAQTENGTPRTLTYQKLVIAIGSNSWDAHLPGVHDHAYALRSVREASRIASVLRNIGLTIKQASSAEERRRRLSVNIIGGGYTGVELAGELADLLPEQLRRQGINIPTSEFGEIRLIEAQPTIMATFDKGLQHEARNILKAKGIRLYEGAPVAEVQPGAIILKNGTRLEAGTTIWAGPSHVEDLLKEAGLPTGPGGRVRVNQYLEAEGFPGIYVLGDAALQLDPVDHLPVPPSAQLAIEHARSTARNIAAELTGHHRRPFHFRLLAEVISLGNHNAIGLVTGRPVEGYPALALKRAIAAGYLTSIGAPSLAARQLLPRLF